MSRLIGIALVALAVFTGPASARESLSVKTEELNELKARIQALRSELEAAYEQKDTLSRQLQVVEEDIGAINRSLHDLKLQMQDQQARLEELQTQKRRHAAELEKQRRRLAQQLRASFAIGRQGYLKLLLNQQDPSAVSRNLIYYDYLNRARSQRINAVTSALDRVRRDEADIARQVEVLDRLYQQQQDKRHALEQRREARSSVLAMVNTRIETKDEELARLTENERQLANLVERLRRALSDVPDKAGHRPFAQLKGQLPWPSEGEIAARFGASRTIGQLKWQGVLIAAPPGDDVRAIYHGRVAFADWLRGFGLLVIIDHGDGYMSLYGHNQSIYKEVGDWVESGEIIASVGSSGGRERPGLYFEVRHNGVPSNPLRWCQRE